MFYFLCLLCSFLFVANVHAADSLYSRGYGDPKHPAVVFLHGGPGYNSASFELSTAKRLADSGFYVIVFDQRGSGRSAGMKGEYNLQEAFADIHKVYKRHKIKRATLIGHSWGGTIGIFFSFHHPDFVNKLVLTGSPISYQHGFRTMRERCASFYDQTGDTVQYKQVMQLRKADSTALMYASMLFQHAAKCGLYKTKVVTEEAQALRDSIKKDTLSKLMQDMTMPPVIGFYKSMRYTTLYLESDLRAVTKKVPVRAIYGDEDGLFDQAHLDVISSAIGSPVTVIKGASHNVFLDQPTVFINSLIKEIRDKQASKKP